MYYWHELILQARFQVGERLVVTRIEMVISVTDSCRLGEQYYRRIDENPLM